MNDKVKQIVLRPFQYIDVCIALLTYKDISEEMIKTLVEILNGINVRFSGGDECYLLLFENENEWQKLSRCLFHFPRLPQYQNKKQIFI